MADLKSFIAFDTQPFAADGANRTLTIVNGWGLPVYIRKAELWMGMSMSGKGDFWALCARTSDGAKVCGTNWDHYAEPTGPHRLWYNFSPDSIALVVGDALILSYGALAQAGILAHIVVYVWWTGGP